MKKLMLFCLLAMTMAVQAQKKITEKDLQGSWIAIKVDDGHAVIEPGKGTAKLTDSAREGLSAGEIAAEEKKLLESMDEYRNAIITFTGNKVRTTLGGEETTSGSFKINEAGTVLTINTDGDSEEAVIVLKDNKLHIHDDINDLNVVFEKMK